MRCRPRRHKSIQEYTVSNNQRDFYFLPDANYSGSETFYFLASDGELISTQDSATISVNAVNDAPEVNPVSSSGDEDTTITITLSGSDVDGTVSAFTLKSLPENGTLYIDALQATQAQIDTEYTVSNNQRDFYFLPDANYSGSETFYFLASDGELISTQDSATISVNAVNDAPEVNPVSSSGDEDTTITITLSGSDVDGTVSAFTLKSLPENGTLYIDALQATQAQIDTEYTVSNNQRGLLFFTRCQL